MADVIVVGAGPTGLWLSAELALAGLSVTVLEQRAEPAAFSKAMGVHARTLEVLAMRGVAEPLLKTGRPLGDWHWGFLRSRLDLSVLDTPYPFMLAVPQARTEAVLEEHARRLGVRILRGRTVTGVHASAAGVVVEAGETFQAAYAVGCDGGGSVVRKEAGIGFPGTDSSVVAFVADAVFDNPPPPGFSVVGPAGSLIVAPAPGGRFRVAGYDPRRHFRSRTCATSSPASPGAISGCGRPSGCHASATPPGWPPPTGPAGCCWPGTPPTSTSRPEASGSTPASRTR
jgi:2-polyprenyl-6-methoxyphenol hydroxylase-like FAD-dependent oxidoreductase